MSSAPSSYSAQLDTIPSNVGGVGSVMLSSSTVNSTLLTTKFPSTNVAV